MLKKWLGIFVMMVVIVAVIGIEGVAYAASDTPTCTTPLDLTTMSDSVDHLDDEGWAWEPTTDGGVLTLNNCYLKSEHKGNGLILGKGNIIVELIGDNTIETTSDLFQPLIFGDDVTWTIREAENDSKLTLKMPDSTSSNLPYGFAGKKLTIESGAIHSEMVLGMPYSFDMSGGSVTVDKGTGSSAAIQALMGNVSLTGGKININGSVCGIAATWNSTELVIDGADVKINATVVALSAKKITYKNGNLDIVGGTRATNVPIETTIQGTGTMTDGTTNQPYDPNANKNFTSFVAKHSHKGQSGVWESNEEKHWSICECGIAMESEAHQYTEKSDTENHWQECICGNKKDIKAHEFGAWVQTKAATQKEKGLQTRTCSACGYEQSKEIPVISTTSTETGDTTPVVVYVLALLLSGVALFLIWHKRIRVVEK